ncbi:MAG: hypothetical protein HKN32_05955, partial [Flavobacteriales bacterium]|nr:hypothetical protein [Flavobacteriales bacterium]
MKSLLTLTLVALSSLLIAQPVLDVSNSVPQVYDIFEQAGTLPVDPTEGGADQTWDFSLSPQNGTQTTTVISPLWTDYSDEYPASNRCFESEGLYTYYEATSEGYTYHGGVESGIVVVYSDPQVYWPLPFTFGDSHSDDFYGEYNAGG